MRSESTEARVVLAFPDMATFGNLARRVAAPLAAASIEVWMVSEDGSWSLRTDRVNLLERAGRLPEPESDLTDCKM